MLHVAKVEARISFRMELEDGMVLETSSGDAGIEPQGFIDDKTGEPGSLTSLGDRPCSQRKPTVRAKHHQPANLRTG